MQNVLNFYRKNTSVISISVCDYQFNTGDTIYFTVKTAPDSSQNDSTALIKADWTIGTDANINDDGTIDLKLSADATDIAYGQYFYDLKLVSVDDTAENTLVTGNLNILDVATLRV